VKPGFDSAQPRFKDPNSTANESSTMPSQQASKQVTGPDNSYDAKNYDPKSVKAPFVSRV